MGRQVNDRVALRILSEPPLRFFRVTLSVPPLIALNTGHVLARNMAKESDSVSSEASGQPERINERVENLRRKTTNLSETLERVEETLEEVREESKE